MEETKEKKNKLVPILIGVIALLLGSIGFLLFNNKEVVEECDLPKKMIGMKDPTVKICKALYGTRNAGADFANHHRRILIDKLQYQEITEVEMNIYTKHDIACGTYIDDGIFVGNDQLIEQEVHEVFQHLKSNKEPRINGGHYLGWTIHQLQTNDPNIKSFFLECTAYIEKIVSFFRMVTNFEGKFKKADVPFRPVKASYFTEDKLKPGTLAKYASTFAGLLLWAARIIRFDIIYSVSVLTTFNQKNWTIYSDERLTQLMAFLETTKGHGLKLQIDRRDVEKQNLILMVTIDSNHGGCPFSMKSTMAFSMIILGKHESRATIDMGSKLSSSPSVATAESELKAIDYFVKTKVIPTIHILEKLKFDIKETIVKTDSSAAKAAIDKGYSIKLRYLAKLQKLNIAQLHHIFTSLGIQLCQEKSQFMTADIGTKDLERHQFTKFQKETGIVYVDPSQFAT